MHYPWSKFRLKVFVYQVNQHKLNFVLLATKLLGTDKSEVGVVAYAIRD